MNKIDLLVKESLEEFELLGLNNLKVTNSVSHDYESGVYGINTTCYLGKELFLHLFIDKDYMIFTVFFEKNTSFLIEVLQGQDLDEYLNRLGTALFLRVKSIILKRSKRSKNLQKAEDLMELLKSKSEVENYKVDKMSIFHEITVEYVVN